MEVREESSTRRNTKPGVTNSVVLLRRRRPRERLEDAHRGGPDRQHAVAAAIRATLRGHLVALTVQHVLLERLPDTGRNVSSPTCRVTRTGSSPTSSGVRWSPAVGAAAEPVTCVHRLIRRDRRVARGCTGAAAPRPRARRRARPASARRRAARRAVPARAAPPAQPPRRAHERLPQAVVDPLDEQHLHRAAGLRDGSRSRAGTTRLSLTTTSSPASSSGSSANTRCSIAPTPAVHEQSRASRGSVGSARSSSAGSS